MPLQLYESQNILDACFTVFARHGYAKTTTAMLAEAAGISKALIFHHFKSKKKLYISVLQRCFEKMAPEMNEETPSDYHDFFEAKEKSGMSKIDYFRQNPDAGKFMFEAMYSTPDELKENINKLKRHLEEKYADVNAAGEQKMKELFDDLPLRDGVDSNDAYELINIVSEHFRMKLAAELTDEGKLSDDAYWKSFFDKKRRYINMIRYGIEQQLDKEE